MAIYHILVIGPTQAANELFAHLDKEQAKKSWEAVGYAIKLFKKNEDTYTFFHVLTGPYYENNFNQKLNATDACIVLGDNAPAKKLAATATPILYFNTDTQDIWAQLTATTNSLRNTTPLQLETLDLSGYRAGSSLSNSAYSLFFPDAVTPLAPNTLVDDPNDVFESIGNHRL